MKFSVFSVILGAVLVSCSAVKLPTYFDRCDLSDPNLGQCMVNSGNKALSTFIKGDKKIHIIPLNPLHVNKMFIDVNGGLQLTFLNFDIFGLETTKLTSLSWDQSRKRVEAEVDIEYTSLIGDYEIGGRILILPINGKGPSNVTFVKPHFKFFFDFELETRKNKEYVKIIDTGMTYDTERTYFKLYNLFMGNQQLGQTMLNFLDENWREVHGELGGRVGSALALVFSNILQSMFYRIPYSELFNE